MRKGLSVVNVFWQRCKQVICIFCVIVTLGVGFLVVANFSEIMKVVYVSNLIDGAYLGETSKEMLFEGAVGGMVDALGDPYSEYLDQTSMESLMEDVSGKFSGIGVYVEPNEANQVVVVAPTEGGPSEKAGIKPGDIIAEVDDESMMNLNINEVVSRMKGEQGTTVKVTVMRDQALKSFDIIRDVIEVETVQGHVLEEDKGIAYIRIAKFASTTADDFVEVLNDLAKEDVQGLIIDLRYNGGGEVGAAANIAKLFLPEGPIVHMVDKNGNTETIFSSGAQVTIPVVVLVDAYSASAAEILAGAMKDTQVATLVGTTTFGKGIVQTIYPLPDGTALKLTMAKYLTPNKNDIHKIGITPDVVVEFPEDMTEETYVDVQLEKAIEVLQEKING